MNNTKVGLALSGGGYRAAAYHLGTLSALHKLGVLNKIQIISSVSGGSIAASYYLLNRGDFDLFYKDFYKKLGSGILSLVLLNIVCVVSLIVLILNFFTSPCVVAIVVICLWRFWYKIFPFSYLVEKELSWKYFSSKTLSDLPDSPALVINTTDVSQGRLFKFSKNRAWGYGYWGDDKKDAFTGRNFPISTAVIASCCVPFAFTPVRMSEKYRINNKFKCPLLVDGGLYDNQGVHVFSKQSCQVHYIVVSNAGNSALSDKNIYNVFKMLRSTSEILMKRIERMQAYQNMFASSNTKRRYAYCNLDYEASDRLITSFVKNIEKGLVPKEVYTLHGILESQVEALQNGKTTVSNKADTIRNKMILSVKDSVQWDRLVELCPNSKESELAKSVKTSLLGLSESERDALIKYAEWMTTIQVRMYLPNILN